MASGTAERKEAPVGALQKGSWLCTAESAVAKLSRNSWQAERIGNGGEAGHVGVRRKL